MMWNSRQLWTGMNTFTGKRHACPLILSLRSMRSLPSARRTARHRPSGAPRTLGGVKWMKGSDGMAEHPDGPVAQLRHS